MTCVFQILFEKKHHGETEARLCASLRANRKKFLKENIGEAFMALNLAMAA